MPCYIYPDLGVVFVRVPKTGSTSVRGQFLGKPLPEHRIFGPIPEKYRYLKSFAYVRHPTERFASAIAMFRKHKTMLWSDDAGRFARTICANSVIDLLDDERVRPGKNNYFELLKLHAIPMTHEHFGLELVERIFRFESFKTEWAELAGFMGVPAPTLVHVKSGKREKPTFTEAEEDRIRRFFAADFERFDYD